MLQFAALERLGERVVSAAGQDLRPEPVIRGSGHHDHGRRSEQRIHHADNIAPAPVRQVLLA
jgi:hypothetical protein